MLKDGRRIERRRGAGFGLKLSEILEDDARVAWSRHLEYNIESLNERDALLGLRVVTPAESRIVRDVFVGLRGRAFDKLRWALDHGVEDLDGYVEHAREAARMCLARGVR